MEVAGSMTSAVAAFEGTAFEGAAGSVVVV
jgi:hypothetical protein